MSSWEAVVWERSAIHRAAMCNCALLVRLAHYVQMVYGGAMPSVHFRVSPISRGQGRSAVATAAYDTGSRLTSVVASAAYRSGEALHDARAGKTFDYTRKEDIMHTEIMAPAHVPEWVQNRQELWNQVEHKEKRDDARLARSIIAGLHRELSTEQNIRMVREFVYTHFTSQGMIADIAIHDKDASDGGRNPHVHIMLTTREITPDGFGPKNRLWDKREALEAWRAGWEEISNRYFAEGGSEARIDMRSYEDQGVDKTATVHLGYEESARERQGIDTPKGDYNRRATQANALHEAAQSWPSEIPPGADADYAVSPYSQQDIEAYHRKENKRVNAIDEPDDSAIRGTTRRSHAEPSRNYERYVARITRTTWYGSREVTTLMPGRGALHPVEARERQRNVVQAWWGNAVDCSRQVAKQVSRMTRHMRDRAEEISKTVFERYAAPWSGEVPRLERTSWTQSENARRVKRHNDYER